MAALFYKHYAGDPYFNMGFDEYLFSKAFESDELFALRLYSWQPGGITIGLNQDKDRAINWSKIGRTPVIRRVTGGRAIYHDPGELTYSVAYRNIKWVDSITAEDLKMFSEKVASALVGFLKLMGISSEFKRVVSKAAIEKNYFHKAPCFASVARHEILSDGQKVIASAQRVVENKILQHGSIKIARISTHEALVGGSEETEKGEVTQAVSFEYFTQAAGRLRGSFESEFGVLFEECEESDGDDNRLHGKIDNVRKNPLIKR